MVVFCFVFTALKRKIEASNFLKEFFINFELMIEFFSTSFNIKSLAQVLKLKRSFFSVRYNFRLIISLVLFQYFCGLTCGGFGADTVIHIQPYQQTKGYVFIFYPTPFVQAFFLFYLLKNDLVIDLIFVYFHFPCLVMVLTQDPLISSILFYRKLESLMLCF